MHIHCTSSRLSRRQFLQWLTAAGAATLLAPWADYASANRHPGRLSWREPVWLMSLPDGVLLQPAGLQPLYGMPGSLMKLVAATALLEERLIHPDDTLECRGSLRIQGQTFHCQHPHGALALREAIGLSCNLFFAQAAERLSTRRFLHYARQYRLHQPVQFGEPVIFPAESAGSQPSQPYVLGLNRNLQPNALQLLRLAGMIAQRAIPGIRPHTWQLLQEGMRLAAIRGTAFALDSDNRWHMAAKTGTTQHGQTFQSWVIGYFPLEKPRYAFCARALAGTAKDSAVPLAHRFFASNAGWLDI
jgi:cell division protein FtsI/penicillin-binding protein 2